MLDFVPTMTGNRNSSLINLQKIKAHKSSIGLGQGQLGT